jgi:hypothetical protein
MFLEKVIEYVLFNLENENKRISNKEFEVLKIIFNEQNVFYKKNEVRSKIKNRRKNFVKQTKNIL